MHIAPSALKRAARGADGAPVVQHIVEFMDHGPSLPVMVLLSLVVGPALVVVHELGHALAALSLTNGPVGVRIGAKQPRWAIRAGRFVMEAGPSEIALAGGFCLYDPRHVSPVRRAGIALSGPFASLAGAALTGVLWSRTGGLVHELLWTATLVGIFEALINGLPLTFEGRQNGIKNSLRLDGRQALDALSELRTPRPAVTPPARNVVAGPVAERWAVEAEGAAERARLQRKRANVTRLRAREDERRTRSVPPPGF